MKKREWYMGTEELGIPLEPLVGALNRRHPRELELTFNGMKFTGYLDLGFDVVPEPQPPPAPIAPKPDADRTWEELAAAFKIQGPIPTRLSIAHSISRGPMLCVVCDTVHRERGDDLEDGFPTQITQITQITAEYDLPAGPPSVGWIRGCVQKVWLHELDEWIHVDGTRRFDPHKPHEITLKLEV